MRMVLVSILVNILVSFLVSFLVSILANILVSFLVNILVSILVLMLPRRLPSPLTSFCDRHGIYLNPKIYLGSSTRRGLFAQSKLSLDECLAVVPFSAVLTKRNLTADYGMHPITDPGVTSAVLGLDEFAVKDPPVEMGTAIKFMLENDSMRNLLQLSVVVLVSAVQPVAKWHEWVKSAGVPKLLEETKTSYKESIKGMTQRELQDALYSPVRHGCNMGLEELAQLLPGGRDHLFFDELVKDAQQVQQILRVLCQHHPLMQDIIKRISDKYFGNIAVVKSLLCDWAFAIVGSRAFGSCFESPKAALSAGVAFQDPFIIPFVDFANNPDKVTLGPNFNVHFENVFRENIAQVLKTEREKKRRLKTKLRYLEERNDPQASKVSNKIISGQSYSHRILRWFDDVRMPRSTMERCKSGYVILNASQSIAENEELLYRYIAPPNNYDANYAFSYGFVPKDSPVGFVSNL